MSEKKTQWLVFQKCCILFLFAALYSFGGLEGFPKELRRFAAPTILCAGMFWYSRDWKIFIGLPFMFGSLSLGYGANALWLKILKRLSYGSANGLSFNIRNLWNKKWIWSAFHIGVVTASYVVLGVWNCLPSARAEEFVLALILGLGIFQTKDHED